MGDVDLEWKKHLTLSTIERVRFGRASPRRESDDRCQYDTGGAGSGRVISNGLESTELVFEDGADEVMGDGD